VAASAIMTLQSKAAVATYAPFGENSTDLHWSVCQRHRVKQRALPPHVEKRNISISVAHGRSGARRMRGDTGHVIGRMRMCNFEDLF